MMSTIAMAYKREGLLEGRQEGRQEGLLEGEQIGLEKGEQVGLRESVRMVLARRFGDVSPWVEARLAGVSDLEVLREAAVEAAVVESLALFEAWLRKVGGGER